jgi:cell wall-associated NlpC family hydrolase
MQILGADTQQAGIDMSSQDLLPEHVVQSLASGDVIFRRGRDVVSRLVLTADGHSDFSHVGVIVRDGWQVNVAHAIPAEAMNELDAVKMETLESFLSTGKATVAAVYRVHRGSTARSWCGEPTDLLDWIF